MQVCVPKRLGPILICSGTTKERELHYHGDLKGSWVMNECSHTRDKITRASSTVKLPEPDKTGKKESRITYERHVWFAE